VSAKIRPPFKAIALIGKYNSREIAESVGALASELSVRGVDIIVEASTAKVSGIAPESIPWPVGDFTTIGEMADAGIVLGGDGTMLYAARQLARYHVPLVGVNQGRLGFMTDIAREDMLLCIDDLLAGKFVEERRMLLDGEIWRGGQKLASSLALNEVVVEKGAVGRLIEFELHINGEFICTMRADGLIISTSTGSTAYSLSANGPILHPRVSGILLVPLRPHSFTNRPIVVDGETTIDIVLTHALDARVHSDCHVTHDLKVDDRVRVSRSSHSISFLHPPGYSYFATLRRKLGWSEGRETH